MKLTRKFKEQMTKRIIGACAHQDLPAVPAQMRTLTLLLRSGELVAEHTLFENEQGFIIGDIDQILLSLSHRLDVLERDGPWKPEVQNSLTPPSKPLWDSCPKLSDQ